MIKDVYKNAVFGSMDPHGGLLSQGEKKGNVHKGKVSRRTSRPAQECSATCLLLRSLSSKQLPPVSLAIGYAPASSLKDLESSSSMHLPNLLYEKTPRCA